MRLSLRHAQAVADEWIRDGVMATDIAIRRIDWTHLLVSSGAGPRERQNRRVEIIPN